MSINGKALFPANSLYQFQYDAIRRVHMFIVEFDTSIAWLKKFELRFPSIAEFGCGEGYETFALMRLLNTYDVTGIDKSSGSITNAKSNAAFFIQACASLFPLTKRTDIPKEVQDVIQYFVQSAVPEYIESNATTKTPLPDNYFDLAYCRKMLYQIACQQIDLPEDERALDAITEMTRVVKPGGVIAAVEFMQCSPDKSENIDLQGSFSKAGLTKLEVFELANTDLKVYCYQKPFLQTE